MFLQLWHVGRQSHPFLQPDGRLPVAPSALSAGGISPTARGAQPHPVPRALERQEIPDVVDEFRRGAQLAQEAGFDGVEVHGANGYLLEQFLADGSNHRTDDYGGPIEHRARFFLEVVRLSHRSGAQIVSAFASTPRTPSAASRIPTAGRSGPTLSANWAASSLPMADIQFACEVQSASIISRRTLYSC